MADQALILAEVAALVTIALVKVAVAQVVCSTGRLEATAPIMAAAVVCAVLPVVAALHPSEEAPVAVLVVAAASVVEAVEAVPEVT